MLLRTDSEHMGINLIRIPTEHCLFGALRIDLTTPD